MHTDEGISISDLEALDWNTLSDEARLRGIHALSNEIGKRATDCEDPEKRRAWRYLAVISSYWLDNGSREEPLRPMLVTRTGRSGSPHDLSEDELDVLKGLVNAVPEPMLRARICDILWIRRKDHEAAGQAASDYLEQFRRCDDGNQWVSGIDELERAFAISRELGAQSECFTTCSEFVLRRISETSDSCDGAFAIRLMHLCRHHRIGDPQELASVAKSIGARIFQDNASLGLGYMDMGASFLETTGDLDAVHQAMREKGELCVQLAESCATDPNRPGGGLLSAVHHMAVGIECLRRGRENESRVKQLHRQLLEWQERTPGEMKRFQHEVNISDLVTSSCDWVSGLELSDAVFKMAIAHPITDVEKLRKRVEQGISDHPITHLFGYSLLTSDGRVAATAPAAIPASEHDGESPSEAVRAEMYRHAVMFDWGLRAQGYIEPCRYTIWNEHRPAIGDLEYLVANNPFIPPGHEMFYLKGIVSGFRGEFDVTAMFLLPQLEASIRYSLQRAGHVTSKLDNRMIQEERSLGILLEMPEAIDVFGKDQVFELRGMLCEKFGWDLRNRMAHGFMGYNECWGAGVVNMWWLVLRLLCIPVLHARRIERSVDDCGSTAT